MNEELGKNWLEAGNMQVIIRNTCLFISSIFLLFLWGSLSLSVSLTLSSRYFLNSLHIVGLTLHDSLFSFFFFLMLLYFSFPPLTAISLPIHCFKKNSIQIQSLRVLNPSSQVPCVSFFISITSVSFSTKIFCTFPFSLSFATSIQIHMYVSLFSPYLEIRCTFL